MNDSNGTAAHRAVEVSGLLQVYGGSWYHAPFFACFLTIDEILIVHENDPSLLRCHSAQAKSRRYHRGP